MNAIKSSRSIASLTLALMMETEPVSETLALNSALARLITREDFVACIIVVYLSEPLLIFSLCPLYPAIISNG
jgi:hypothetical protein